MIEISNKKYKCPYCSQTSRRKYNIDIHTQRKHQRTLAKHLNQPSNPHFSNNFKELNQFSYDLNSSMEQPSSFSSSTFCYPDYNDNKEDEKERRSRRRFDSTTLKYIQKIVIPQLNSANFQFNNCASMLNIYPPIDSKKMPKAHKIYKCDKCHTQTLEAFFDYQNTHPVNEFDHYCFNQQKYEGNNDPKLLTLKLQQTLLSVIDYRLGSENILLKMSILPNSFIENSICMEITKFFIDILKDQDYPYKWIFKLLENERFVDLGEINADHWARRACDSNPENVTILEKEELKQFINIMEGTFGLITFKIDKKPVYSFSYIPLSKWQKEF
jgi:ribosomal protein L37AE/L43A